MAFSTLTRRTLMALGTTVLASLALGLPASAQQFPDRTITLVVPFAAGGSTDVVARIIAQKMGDGLGQQVIVENVGGAGGSLGADRVARAHGGRLELHSAPGQGLRAKLVLPAH